MLCNKNVWKKKDNFIKAVKEAMTIKTSIHSKWSSCSSQIPRCARVKRCKKRKKINLNFWWSEANFGRFSWMLARGRVNRLVEKSTDQHRLTFFSVSLWDLCVGIRKKNPFCLDLWAFLKKTQAQTFFLYRQNLLKSWQKLKLLPALLKCQKL